TPLAQAFDFTRGDLEGSLDTTVSYGVSIRAEDPDEDLIGKATINPLIALAGQTINPPFNVLGAFPGSAAQAAAPGRWSANRDDGNIKYDQGDLFSNAFKITSELELKYHNWGVFARASYFYDFTNTQDKYADFMTNIAQKRVGTSLDMYDYFIFNNYTIGANDEISGSVRLGNQVLNWGEGTFLQNGLNVINPIDVSRLRVAGAELKEALLPSGMIWGSIQFTDALSFEAYYQYEWEPVRIDPSGTYFSANDFASPGGEYIMLGFGTVMGPVINPERFGDTCIIGQNAAGQVNYANSDKYEALAAQYGGGPVGYGTAKALIQSSCAAAGLNQGGRDASDQGQFGLALRWFAEDWNQTEFGFYAMNYHSKLPLLSGQAAKPFPTTPGFPLAQPNTAALIVEYPEDIHLFGVSFNTTLPGGVAWQGEFSYRPNMPFQIDDVEVLFASLTPLNPLQTANGAPVTMLFTSQLGSYGAGDYIQGYRELDQSQVQMTFTKAFAQVLGASQIALVAELGATQVGLPDKSVLRFEGEGTDTGGGVSLGDDLLALITAYNTAPSAATGAALQAALYNPLNAGALRNPVTQVDGFPTNFSWGYRIAARADYNSVFGTSVTLSPRLAFAHDVNGITPGPGGNFLEGRTALTAGVEANYLNSWVFDLSYTTFGGASGLNQIADRDFYSLAVKYSF
ncbi:MAG: DUF1302 domain-containing protein, partial [Arenimonas sp.]|nr:DUF1302 domain-containing protein [Arenimonas sp.]